jgi:hypothetical membrane protein
MSTSNRLGSSRPTQPSGNDDVRRLLMAGTVAGPLYLGVGFAQAVVRDGFDITQHAFSLLANGRFGWIQIVNLVLTGALVIIAAQGVRRALELADPSGRGARSSGRLLSVYGASLIVAGVFTADPALGFPPGTPAGPTPISWHGLVHFAAGGVGFACFIAACLVLARRFHRQGMRPWAIFSAATGVIFLFAFLGISSGSQGPTTLAFVGAVTLSFVWLLALTRKLARTI